MSIVSVYSQQQGVVLRSLLDGIFRPESFAATQAFEHKSNRELKVVQKLLETLALKELVVTLDALHCQKKQQS